MPELTKNAFRLGEKNLVLEYEIDNLLGDPKPELPALKNSNFYKVWINPHLRQETDDFLAVCWNRFRKFFEGAKESETEKNIEKLKNEIEKTKTYDNLIKIINNYSNWLRDNADDSKELNLGLISLQKTMASSYDNVLSTGQRDLLGLEFDLFVYNILKQETEKIINTIKTSLNGHYKNSWKFFLSGGSLPIIENEFTKPGLESLIYYNPEIIDFTHFKDLRKTMDRISQGIVGKNEYFKKIYPHYKKDISDLVAEKGSAKLLLSLKYDPVIIDKIILKDHGFLNTLIRLGIKKEEIKNVKKIFEKWRRANLIRNLFGRIEIQGEKEEVKILYENKDRNLYVFDPKMPGIQNRKREITMFAVYTSNKDKLIDKLENGSEDLKDINLELILKNQEKDESTFDIAFKNCNFQNFNYGHGNYDKRIIYVKKNGNEYPVLTTLLRIQKFLQLYNERKEVAERFCIDKSDVTHAMALYFSEVNEKEIIETKNFENLINLINKHEIIVQNNSEYLRLKNDSVIIAVNPNNNSEDLLIELEKELIELQNLNDYEKIKKYDLIFQRFENLRTNGIENIKLKRSLLSDYSIVSDMILENYKSKMNPEQLEQLPYNVVEYCKKFPTLYTSLLDIGDNIPSAIYTGKTNNGIDIWFYPNKKQLEEKIKDMGIFDNIALALNIKMEN